MGDRDDNYSPAFKTIFKPKTSANAPVQNTPYVSPYTTPTYTNPISESYITANPVTTPSTTPATSWNIPSDVYPTTTTYSGLPLSIQTQLASLFGQATPAIADYQKTLKSLASPASFISAYKPVQKGINESLINSLANKGILQSQQANNILGTSAQNVTSQYLQKLMELAGVQAQGTALPLSIADAMKYTSSYQANPLAPYELMAQILLGT